MLTVRPHKAQPFLYPGELGHWQSRDLTFAEDGFVANVCPEGRCPDPLSESMHLGWLPHHEEFSVTI